MLDQLKRCFIVKRTLKNLILILIFSFVPIVPVDLMGLFSGAIGYDVKKFYIACQTGKILRYLTLGLATYYGISIALGIFGDSF